MNSITSLSVKTLLRAAMLKSKIESLEKQLSRLLGASEAAPKSTPKKRRKMSRVARMKIAASARKRWAAARKAGKKRL